MIQHVRVSVIVAVMVVTGMFLPRMGATRESMRDVTVVVKNMTYYVDGGAEPNPPLRFFPGEQVRLTLKNEDKGMQHDFRIPDWEVGIGSVEWSTEKTTTFRVPASAGPVTYVCTPHAAMMSGRILIAK